jgi:hypothetical protein
VRLTAQTVRLFLSVISLCLCDSVVQSIYVKPGKPQPSERTAKPVTTLGSRHMTFQTTMLIDPILCAGGNPRMNLSARPE